VIGDGGEGEGGEVGDKDVREQEECERELRLSTRKRNVSYSILPYL
jgi:hypothetical protein